MNGEGTVLGERSDPTNRLDGTRNVLIKGLNVVGEKSGKLTGDEAANALLGACKAVSSKLNGVRGNVKQAEVLFRTDTEDGLVVGFTMQEGVKIYVYDALNLVEKKAMEGLNKYLSLSVEQKTYGMIMVYTNAIGEVNAVWVENDVRENA